MAVGQDRAGYVYVIQDGSGLCKIGRARDVQKRLKTLSTAASSKLDLVASWPCDDASEREAIMHEFWSDLRVRGEWFRIPDHVVALWREDDGTRIPAEADEDAWFEAIHGVELSRARRNAAPAEKLKRPWRELPQEDGGWWISRGSQQIACKQCHRSTRDEPGVMRYLAAADLRGIQARCYPDWPVFGWVVWRQCEHCSWMDFKTEYVTIAQIRAWEIGPWRPMP